MPVKPRPILKNQPVDIRPAMAEALEHKLTNFSLWHNGTEWVASIQVEHSRCWVETGSDPLTVLEAALHKCKELPAYSTKPIIPKTIIRRKIFGNGQS